jgi:hypothetical protein
MQYRRTPQEQVAKVLTLCHRGLICPTEMWLQLAECLKPAAATAVLHSLPEDFKEQLRATAREWPPASAYSDYIKEAGSVLRDEDLRTVCLQVIHWCEC